MSITDDAATQHTISVAYSDTDPYNAGWWVDCSCGWQAGETIAAEWDARCAELCHRAWVDTGVDRAVTAGEARALWERYGRPGETAPEPAVGSSS